MSWFLFEPPTARTWSNSTKSKTGPLSKQVVVISGLVSSFHRTRHTYFFGVRMSVPASGASVVSQLTQGETALSSNCSSRV